jgi:hypothetical protein
MTSQSAWSSVSLTSGGRKETLNGSACDSEMRWTTSNVLLVVCFEPERPDLGVTVSSIVRAPWDSAAVQVTSRPFPRSSPSGSIFH